MGGHGAEVQADRRQNEEQGDDLDERQVLLDDIGLLRAGGDGARDPHESPRDRRSDVVARVPLRRARATGGSHVEGEQQGRDRRGRPFASHCAPVADGVGYPVASGLAERRQDPLVQLDHALCKASLTARRQALRVTSDDDGAAEQGEVEQLGRALLGLDHLPRLARVASAPTCASRIVETT